MKSETDYKVAGGELPMMVHVTAPATLPAGYTFEAEINGDPNKLFTCEVVGCVWIVLGFLFVSAHAMVHYSFQSIEAYYNSHRKSSSLFVSQPEGGVNEGQVFLAPLSKSYDGPRLAAPTGSWKDGLFGCCNVGFTHPSLWCSLCCRPLAMAQVMSRMQLSWWGLPGPLAQTSKTFQVVLMLLVAFYVYAVAMEVAMLLYPTPDDTPHLALSIARIAGVVLFSLWWLMALCNTRKTVRQRYQIPGGGCEDVCCSLFCSCCTVSQMMRHTGEYETFPGTWCSATGHPPGTPLVV